MSDYPELDRLDRVHDESQIIRGFLEWLQDEQGLAICEFNDKDYYNGKYIPDKRDVDHLLADHFEIDLIQVEKERRAMLDRIRKVGS